LHFALGSGPFQKEVAMSMTSTVSVDDQKRVIEQLWAFWSV
jgi:hypothetical protein